MNRHLYKNLTIEIVDEPAYTLNSVDPNFNYAKHYSDNNGKEHPVSKHGIKVFHENKEISNCIIIGSGGATGIHQNSSLVDSGQLVVCCGNTVFCLTLPYLDLKWKTQADPATCFQIFKQQENYIVHGELRITKLDMNGEIKWEFGGNDIFVATDGEEEFILENDGIVLTDFGKTKYKIDFDGKLLWNTHKR